MNTTNYQEYNLKSLFGKSSYSLKVVKIGLRIKLRQRVVKIEVGEKKQENCYNDVCTTIK